MSSKVVTIENYNNNNNKKNKQIKLLLSKTQKYKKELDELKEKHEGFKKGAIHHNQNTKKEYTDKITLLNNKIKELEEQINTLTIKGSFEFSY